MNQPQNLPTALAFWGAPGIGSAEWILAAKKQTFRMSYCDIDPSLIAVQSRYDRLIPFLVERPTSDLPIAVLLMQKDATGYNTVSPVGYADITTLLSPVNFAFDGRQFIEFINAVDINQATTIPANTFSDPTGIGTYNWGNWVENEGLYFIVLVFADGVKLYSELIQIVDFPEFSEEPDSPCKSRIRIECTNNCEIGGIPPVNLAAQKVFLYYETSKPTYPLEKSVSTDGNKQEKIMWAKVKKRWQISFYGTERSADFFSLLPLYGSLNSGINITDTYGVQSGVSDVDVEISWPEETQDCLALIVLSFTREFVSFTNCC